MAPSNSDRKIKPKTASSRARSKKRVVKKTRKRTAPRKTTGRHLRERSKVMAKHPVGTVTHYYGNLQVGIVTLAGTVTLGDTLQFLGHGADFKQKITSMQINHSAVQKASAGAEVGVRVKKRVREGTEVYKVLAKSQGWFSRLKELFR